MTMKNMNRNSKCYRSQSGITLIELLIAVVLVSILAASAYPSYTQFVVRAKRTAGKTALLRVADRQQQYFMDNKRYAGSLTALGYQENPFMVRDDGAYVVVADPGRVYQIVLATPTPTSYVLTAVPQMMMASKDTNCGTLSLSSTGQKGNSGGGSRCW